MATFNLFDSFVAALAAGTHNFDAAGHVFKAYLSNATPDVSNDTYKADLAGITEQNNYAASDIQNAIAATGGVCSVTATDFTWTATGSVGPFKYLVIYNSTAANSELVGWAQYSTAEVTLATGESFTVDFQPTLLTIS